MPMPACNKLIPVTSLNLGDCCAETVLVNKENKINAASAIFFFMFFGFLWLFEIRRKTISQKNQNYLYKH